MCVCVCVLFAYKSMCINACASLGRNKVDGERKKAAGENPAEQVPLTKLEDSRGI